MKQPSKFKRWFLGLFGGVPKSDYEEMKIAKDEYVDRMRVLVRQKQELKLSLKDVQEENELLKKQIAHDPMTPVVIKTQNVKIKEIKRVAAIGPLPLDKTEFCLRDAVLMEAAPFVKIEQQPYNMTMTATLLLAEKEDD